MGMFDKIYAKSPRWLQNIGIQLYGVYWHGLRFGGEYRDFVNAYEKREGFLLEEWNHYQEKQLRELLKTAVTKIPYYQQTYSDEEKDFAKKGELSKLPLLGKEPLRQNPRNFLREDMRVKPEIIFHTSGTTGTPIQSFWTKKEVREAMAVRETRSCRWAKVSFKLPRGTFSGRMIEPDPDSQGPFYRFNAVEKQVYFSAFHLSPMTAEHYVRALRKHKIEWLTGYAVSFYLLAKYILEQNLQVPPLKAVITTSEKLTPEMRTIMEKAYQCQVYEEYSTVENSVFASECEEGKLHVSPDVGVLEVLKEDGSPCSPGEVGEAVVTCLMHGYQIVIRFKTGDLVRMSPESCTCGRAMPVIEEVIGRLEDVVTGPDGRQMVRFHGLFVEQPHVVEGQVIQESRDTFRLKIVPDKRFDEKDEQDLISRMHQRLGTSIKVKIDKTDHISRDESGKFRAVISHLGKDESL